MGLSPFARTDFLFEGGSTGALMAALGQTNSPLGAPENWSSTLRTTVGLALRAEAQIVLFWGPEFVALYNDAYAPTIGDKHPQAMGRPAPRKLGGAMARSGPTSRRGPKYRTYICSKGSALLYRTTRLWRNGVL